jgi:nucleoside-triphosphatase
VSRRASGRGERAASRPRGSASAATAPGFRLETLDGTLETLACVDLRSPPRVGACGVDVTTFDRVAASTLRADPAVQVYVVDEIGRMEC